MKILIVGATGSLGSHLVSELAKNPSAEILALVRNEQDPKVKPLLDQGVRLLQGDLSDSKKLADATKGMDLVISVVRGGAEVMLDGQLNLLRAADESRVPRMIASDFSTPMKDMKIEDHVFLGLRAEFHRRAQAKHTRVISIQQGAFIEVIFHSSFDQNADVGSQTVAGYGDGNDTLQFTSIEDTAKFTAAVAFDVDAPADVYVSGDVTSWSKVAQDLSRAYGTEFKFKSLGSLNDLKNLLAEKRASGANPMSYIGPQYLWAMLRPEAKITEFKSTNDRYSQVKPDTVLAYAQKKASLH
jgi:nucleoside-diphosphate-sugar epimerase